MLSRTLHAREGIYRLCSALCMCVCVLKHECMISVIPVKWSSRGGGTGILLYCLTIHAICSFKGAVGPDFSLTVSTFFYCRRPFFVLFSLPFMPPSSLYINYSIPLQLPTHSIILLISLFFCLPVHLQYLLFFILFLQNHHHFSLSSSSISFFTLRCLSSSPVFVSLLPTTT